MSNIFKIMTAGILALGLGAAWAMTPDEAKTRVQQHAAGKGLEAKDVSQAVSTLERLVAKGAPVEHAYNVVEAAIDDGIRGTELADIARAMEREMARGVDPKEATEHAMDRMLTRAHERALREDLASPTRGEFGPRGGMRGRPGGGHPGGFGGARPAGRP